MRLLGACGVSLRWSWPNVISSKKTRTFWCWPSWKISNQNTIVLSCVYYRGWWSTCKGPTTTSATTLLETPITDAENWRRACDWCNVHKGRVHYRTWLWKSKCCRWTIHLISKLTFYFKLLHILRFVILIVWITCKWSIKIKCWAYICSKLRT